jgi:hypothetical protein
MRLAYRPRMARLAPILLCVLAFAVASCGGGDDAPSQEEFADRANEICREAEQSLENVGEEARTPEEIVPAVDRVIDELRDAVDRLGDLERPDGEAGERAEEFVNATRTQIEEGIPVLEDLRAALESGDQEAAQEAATRLQGIGSGAANEAAREVGANDCADE